MSITELFKTFINSILDGSFERMRIINGMNQSFKDFFCSGEFNRMCHVTISAGDQDFAHPMSSFWFRSGFKIVIENDNNLSDGEVEEIAQVVLSNVRFLRQLMSLGFDTLIVQGKMYGRGKKFSLKAYADLNSYFLEK